MAIRRIFLTALFMPLITVMTAGHLLAATPALPAASAFKVYVFGDSLGHGLWSGLYRAFRDNKQIKVVKKTKISTGFGIPSKYNWNRNLDKLIKNKKVHYAAVMIGANDWGGARSKRRWHNIGTPGWQKIYGQRIEDFMRKLKAANIKSYWVGLPVMRKSRFRKSAKILNDIYRQKAAVTGVVFIESWSHFADKAGNYKAYGPDIEGRKRLLRANDGTHFTPAGYRKLAQLVENEIKRNIGLTEK